MNNGARRLGLMLVENTQGGICGGTFRGVLHPLADILKSTPHVNGCRDRYQASHEHSVWRAGQHAGSGQGAEGARAQGVNPRPFKIVLGSHYQWNQNVR